MDEVRAWQSRPLETVYPIVFFDCMVVKVRHDKRIINKAIYVALGRLDAKISYKPEFRIRNNIK